FEARSSSGPAAITLGARAAVTSAAGGVRRSQPLNRPGPGLSGAFFAGAVSFPGAAWLSGAAGLAGTALLSGVASFAGAALLSGAASFAGTVSWSWIAAWSGAAA